MIEQSPSPPPPDRPEQPGRPLDYVRLGTAKPDASQFPAAAGFVVGFVLYFAIGVIWLGIGRVSDVNVVFGLAIVPLVSMVAASVLHGAFGWRGVVAGVLTAMGLSILIPGVAIMVICGTMRLK
jgi:hypothetical protein